MAVGVNNLEWLGVAVVGKNVIDRVLMSNITDITHQLTLTFGGSEFITFVLHRS